MSHYVLYVSQDGSESAPWPLDLSARGIVVLHTRSPEQALPFCRAYPLLMVLLEIKALDETWSERFGRLRAAIPPQNRPALVGVAHVPLESAERAALAAEGLDGVVMAHDPESFLVRQLDTLVRLAELSVFEQSRAEVAQLSLRTREHLHELSQPLSAIQGRLQLLAARATDADPNARNLQELVQLSFKVSSFVMELQQLHRKYS